MTKRVNRPHKKPGFAPRPLDERFWAQVERGDGCWLWRGSVSARTGYGKIQIADGRKTALAHRVSWALARGPIPPGMFVCHHCDVRACVRPEHLFIGTHSDNMLDSVAKGRHRESRKTQCSHGHTYSPPNGYTRSNGRRACRECDRAHSRQVYARKRAERHAECSR